MPFLGHNPYEGLDVSPDATPAAVPALTADLRARLTVHRFAVSGDDEAMLLELLGLAEADAPV